MTYPQTCGIVTLVAIALCVYCWVRGMRQVSYLAAAFAAVGAFRAVRPNYGERDGLIAAGLAVLACVILCLLAGTRRHCRHCGSNRLVQRQDDDEQYWECASCGCAQY